MIGSLWAQLNYTLVCKHVAKTPRANAETKTIEDAHQPIKYALSQLNDRQSFLVSAKDLKTEYTDKTMKKNTPIVSEYNNGIVYIKIPGFFGNAKLEKVFADRNKTLDGKKIIPDDIAKDGDAKDLAIKWINWTMIL